MAYQTGSATSSTNLIQELATFLVANGWTQDSSATEGSGWSVHAHLGSQYVHLRACENEGSPWAAGYPTNHYGVHMYCGTGYASGAFDSQAGGPVASGGSNAIGVGMQLTAGPFSNYFFFCDSDGDDVVVVVEKTSGVFLFLAWGSSIEKAGAFTGGPYFYGSTSSYYTSYTFASSNVNGFTSSSDCPGVNTDAIGGGAGFVRADVDSFTGLWIGICGVIIGGNQGYTGKPGDSSVKSPTSSMRSNFPVYAYQIYPYQFQNGQVSEQDARANLLPIYQWVLRDSTTTGYSLLGAIPNLFASNAVGNGYSATDEYVIGSDTYKLFPNFAVLKQT